MIPKIIAWVKSNQQGIFWGVCGLLLLFISFNLGRIYAFQKTAISIKEVNTASFFNAVNNSMDSTTGDQNPNDKSSAQNESRDQRVVASKNSDKYHYTWCSGAKRIKEENKVWFNSATEAEKAGYTLAGNCQ